MTIGMLLGYAFIIIGLITQVYIIFVMLLVTKAMNVLQRTENAKLIEQKMTNEILHGWHEEVQQQRDVSS